MGDSALSPRSESQHTFVAINSSTVKTSTLLVINFERKRKNREEEQIMGGKCNGKKREKRRERGICTHEMCVTTVVKKGRVKKEEELK